MAENTSRGLFKLNGITGMLIATALLLGILFFLEANAIAIQNVAIKKPYDATKITGPDGFKNITAVSKDNAKYDLTKL